MTPDGGREERKDKTEQIYGSRLFPKDFPQSKFGLRVCACVCERLMKAL